MILLRLAFLFLLASVSAAHAAPVQPMVTDPFVLDEGWGAGGHTAWRYYGPLEGRYEGRKAIVLANGEVVALGSVGLPGSPLHAGLTLHDSSGQPLLWPNADPRYANNGYNLLFPGLDTTVPAVHEVRDLARDGDRFYVLVTLDLRPPAYPNIYAPGVICFNADGSACGWWYAYIDGGRVTNDAVAMDIRADRLIVLGRNQIGDSGGFWTVRWDIAANGALQNPTFGSIPSPGGFDRTEPVDIALRPGGLLAADGSYYVLYSKTWSVTPPESDPCLFAAKADHTPDFSFPDSNDGVRCRWFDEPNSSQDDDAVALAVDTYTYWIDPPGIPAQGERVYVLADVARAYASGFGIWALRDRSDDTAFGPDGKAVFGGCGEALCHSPVINSSDRPASIATIGADLAIVGTSRTDFLGSLSDDPLFALVGADDGVLRQLTALDSGYGDGGLNGLVVRDAKHVVGVGVAIDPTVAAPDARTQITIGLTSNDVIFADGFD